MSFLVRFYNHVMREWTDPKTRDWVINKPSTLIPIMISYIGFCVIVGPAFMKNRKPYRITRIIQVYNISQVILNTVLAIAGLISVLHYNWLCQPVDYTMDPKEIRVTWVAWFYCVTKLYDLLDTVFFILRKKFSQVSLLHLYHHVTMGGPFIYATNFYSTGHAVFPFGLNMVVHIFMYFYYFIASLGPEYHKHLWWKRHLTEMQIIQFGLAFVHTIVAFYKSCGVPLFIIIYFLGQSAFFALLFSQFYYYAYLQAKPQAQKNGVAIKQTTNGVHLKMNGVALSEKIKENGTITISGKPDKHCNGHMTNGNLTNGKLTNGTMTNGKISNGKVENRKSK